MNKNEEDFLKFYMEQTWEEMRHLENLRERVSVIIITLASAIAGFVIQQKFASETKPLIWFIVLLGFFGLFMALKIFQIHQKGQERLNKWYSYIESNCGDNPQILILRDQADKANKKNFKFISKIPHNYFWTTMHMFIIIAGITLLFFRPSKEIEVKPSANTITVILKDGIKSDTVINKKDSLENKTK